MKNFFKYLIQIIRDIRTINVLNDTDPNLVLKKLFKKD